jgi:hypothetical protein
MPASAQRHLCSTYAPISLTSTPNYLWRSAISQNADADADLQTKAEALTYYTTKSDFVQTNLETLQKTIEKKQDNVHIVVGVLQAKMQEGGQGQAQKA